jgi:hypothetical protein
LNIRIIGTILWSEIFNENKKDIQNHLNDYHKIFKNNKNDELIDTNDTNKLFYKKLDFLKNEIDNSKKNNEICIVLTHHGKIINFNFISSINLWFMVKLFKLLTVIQLFIMVM